MNMENYISGNWVSLLNKLIEEGKLSVQILTNFGIPKNKLLQILNGDYNKIGKKETVCLGNLAMAIEYGISDLKADDVMLSKIQDLFHDGFTEEMLSKIFQIETQDIRNLMEGKQSDFSKKYDLSMKIDYLHGFIHTYK